MGWQWHQLDHMQIICTSLQTDNHASTSPLRFLRAGCPSCHPTNSVKALKANLLLSLSVKKFWKSVSIWQSYSQTYNQLPPVQRQAPSPNFMKIHPKFCKICSGETDKFEAFHKLLLWRMKKANSHSLLTSIDCCNENSSTAGSKAGRNGSNRSSLAEGPPAVAVTTAAVIGWPTPSVVFEAIIMQQNLKHIKTNW